MRSFRFRKLPGYGSRCRGGGKFPSAFGARRVGIAPATPPASRVIPGGAGAVPTRSVSPCVRLGKIAAGADASPSGGCPYIILCREGRATLSSGTLEQWPLPRHYFCEEAIQERRPLKFGRTALSSKLRNYDKWAGTLGGILAFFAKNTLFNFEQRYDRNKLKIAGDRVDQNNDVLISCSREPQFPKHIRIEQKASGHLSISARVAEGLCLHRPAWRGIRLS
jgi:hypothetical protein